MTDGVIHKSYILDIQNLLRHSYREYRVSHEWTLPVLKNVNTSWDLTFFFFSFFLQSTRVLRFNDENQCRTISVFLTNNEYRRNSWLFFPFTNIGCTTHGGFLFSEFRNGRIYLFACTVLYVRTASACHTFRGEST